MQLINELVAKSEDLNWSTVLKLAQQHGVKPILQQTLRTARWDAIPRQVQAELDGFSVENLKKSLYFVGELFKLIERLKDQRTDVVTFKGPILAETLYGDLSLRQFVDLDILVRQPDLRKAEDVLTALGYEAHFPDRDFRSTFLSYQGQYAFRHRQTGTWVDLHWQFSSRGASFPITPEEVWSKSQQVRVADRLFATLTDDDLALFLAAHGTKEAWRRLVWVSDFARLLCKHHDIDWKQVLTRARQSDSSRPLLLAIFLSSTLLDAPAPAELLEEARNDAAVLKLADKAKQQLVYNTEPGELGDFLNTLSTHTWLRYRLWPAVVLLTTRTVGDYQAMPLPKSLWGIYYLTRPFRLANKAVKTLLT
ncbi:MAG: nucleotidyltransferase family protein [Hyphomicrobiales bacterium]|nr:nucleotidyltransferase family protein [Hyphomicrobiales bacterium]